MQVVELDCLSLKPGSFPYWFLWQLSGKESIATNAGDLGSIPESEHPLEKEMATHSSILAWEIPCTEEPGGLHSMGTQKSWT